MPNPPHHRLCLPALLLLALAGILLPRPDPAAAASSDSTPDSGADSSAVRASAPDSSSFDPARHVGKVVYLDFWASWCPPCKLSFPWMKELQERHGAAGLEVIAVNLDKRRGAASEFLAKAAPNFEIVWDPEGRLARRYELQGMPTTILFDRNGHARATHVGYQAKERASIEAEIQGLLGERAGEREREREGEGEEGGGDVRRE